MLILFAALGGEVLVSPFIIFVAVTVAESHITLFVALAGGAKSRHMPFLTMTTSLVNSGIQLMHYPFNLPFPSEINNTSKGVESLSLLQQVVLKEGFLQPETPITFQKVQNDADVQCKSLNSL